MRFLTSRLLKVAGASVVGVAVALAAATPALACHTEFKKFAKAACVTESTGKVVWTFTASSDGRTAQIEKVEYTIDGVAATGGTTFTPNQELKDGTWVNAELTVPRTAKKAVLTVHLYWPAIPGKKGKAEERKANPKEVDLTKINWKPCEVVPSESSNSSSSAPASSSGVASVSSSAASGALPVTGSNTGLLAGGAIVLVGAGAALFFVARRRRIKFTAA